MCIGAPNSKSDNGFGEIFFSIWFYGMMTMAFIFTAWIFLLGCRFAYRDMVQLHDLPDKGGCPYQCAKEYYAGNCAEDHQLAAPPQ